MNESNSSANDQAYQDPNESVTLANLVRRASKVVNIDVNQLKEMQEIKSNANKAEKYNA
jgi:hypothetical protein